MLSMKISVDLRIKTLNEFYKPVFNIISLFLLLQNNINMYRWEICDGSWVIFYLSYTFTALDFLDGFLPLPLTLDLEEVLLT